jgi:hypothetical protein
MFDCYLTRIASTDRFRFKKPAVADDAVSIVAETVQDHEVEVDEKSMEFDDKSMEFDEDPCDLVDLMDELEEEERGDPSVTSSASFLNPGLGLGGTPQW